MVGASPGVPPGLALGQGQIWQEGGQGPLDLVGFAAEGVLSGTVVGALSIETHVVGWEGEEIVAALIIIISSFIITAQMNRKKAK